MKRYGNNLPSNIDREEDTWNGTCSQFMLTGCAVRQDMVGFLMPINSPNKHKTWNIFSFFKFRQKKFKENNR